MANPAEHSAAPELFDVEPAQEIVAEGHGETVAHAQPELLGLVPFQWVSLSMVVLLLIAFFGAKVHKTIAGGLDSRIAAIKTALDEAKALRAEAEALRAEYAAKIAGAEADAEAMLVGARREAGAIVSKAEADTIAMIARREQMARDKIGAAERQAVAELRATAANAAAAAATGLIVERHDAAADSVLADKAIAAL
jgi:F-type H+-transporting ATPase subunit b